MKLLNAIAFGIAPPMLVFNAMMAVLVLFNSTVSFNGFESALAKIFFAAFFAAQAAFWAANLFQRTPPQRGSDD